MVANVKQKLLIATRSRGKLPEIIAVLEESPFECVTLDQAGIPDDFTVSEPAMTCEGNAIIKSIMHGKKAGCLTLAEDAGLEVDALGGRPGVLSARYAPGTDKDRYEKLLKELAGVSKENRSARFRAVVALYDPKKEKIRTCEGVYEGTIAMEPKGSNGFGYDPVFYNNEFQKTNAEMTMEEKNLVSHRGIAIKRAKAILHNDFL